MDGIQFKSAIANTPDWLTVANESFSIFESSVQLRRFVRETFLQNAAQYRKLEASFSSAQLSLSQLSRSLPTQRTIAVPKNHYVTSGADSIASVLNNVQTFLNTRTALIERYSSLLESIVRDLSNVEHLKINQINTIEAFNFYAIKTLAQFTQDSILGLFSGVEVRENSIATVPVIGPYILEVSGAVDIDVRCSECIGQVSKMVVDICRYSDEPELSLELPLASSEELQACLKIVEGLIGDLHRERIKQRYESIITYAEQFESQTERRYDQYSSMNLAADVRSDGMKALTDQKHVARCMTRCAAYPLLKIDNLSVHVAMQILNLCNQHLSVYR